MKNVAIAVHGEPIERLTDIDPWKRSALAMENVALSLKLQTTGATMRNVALASKRKKAPTPQRGCEANTFFLALCKQGADKPWEEFAFEQ